MPISPGEGSVIPAIPAFVTLPDLAVGPTIETGAFTYTGAVRFVTQAPGDNSTLAANTAFVTAAIAAIPASGGTVKATAGVLTLNSVVLGAGTIETKVAAGIVTDGVSVLTLGVAGGAVGGLKLNNATSGSITLQPVTGALGTVTLSLPAVTSTLAALAAAQSFTAAQTISVNGAASTPPLALTGTIFTGGSATTTKPALLIEPTGTTSTGWSTNGTGIGVNLAAGFVGNFVDCQINGARVFRMAASGEFYLPSGGAINFGDTSTYVYASANGRLNITDANIVPSVNGVLLVGCSTGVSVALSASATRFSLFQSNLSTVIGLTCGSIICTTLAPSGSLTMADAQNIVVNATTGTKIATATTQKLGFWNVTPVIQPASATQAVMTDSTTGTIGTTLVDVGVAFSQANVNNNFASLNALVTAIRLALVNTGIIKGAA